MKYYFYALASMFAMIAVLTMTSSAHAAQSWKLIEFSIRGEGWEATCDQPIEDVGADENLGDRIRFIYLAKSNGCMANAADILQITFSSLRSQKQRSVPVAMEVTRIAILTHADRAQEKVLFPVSNRRYNLTCTSFVSTIAKIRNPFGQRTLECTTTGGDYSAHVQFQDANY